MRTKIDDKFLKTKVKTTNLFFLSVPQVDETLCGQWTYAFTKMCTFSGLSKNEIVDALNTYVLGLSKPHINGFTLPDLRIVKPANSR